jgi:predicted acyl esterase
MTESTVPEHAETAVSYGAFADGPISGLDYHTATHSGVTDTQGRFRYQPGETVSFSIGGLQLGSAAGASSLTLMDLTEGCVRASREGVIANATANRARFILSLAREADMRDGVDINHAFRQALQGKDDRINFDCSPEEFAQDGIVAELFEALGLRLRSLAEVRNHERRVKAGITVLRNERVPTRDGSYLLADVFHPAYAQPKPVLLRLGIYGKAFHIGSIVDQDDFDASEAREDAWHQDDRDHLPVYVRHAETAGSANPSHWVPRDYVVVWVDGRGIGHTPGKLDPFSKQEAEDYYDAIEWAASQPWSDGNVGLYGASYLGTIQWNVAGLRPPSLKAIAPFASDTDAYRDLAYQGGIFLGDYRRAWYRDFVGVGTKAVGEAVDIIGGMTRHPWDDDFYRSDGPLSADLTRIDVPVLTAVSQVGMLHGRAGCDVFNQIRHPSKQLLVVDDVYFPFFYGDCLPDLELFFDRFLKGKEPKVQPPAVRMIMRTGEGSYEWRDESAWPVPGTEYQSFFLGARSDDEIGVLANEASEPILFAEYSADAVASAPAIPMAVFESAPLETDLELGGHFRANIWISSTSADADLYVSLRVMNDNGEVSYHTRGPANGAPLTWGCLKVSHRALDPERSRPERPWHTHRRQDGLPLTPGDVVKVELELLPATARVAAGSRLRVEMSPVQGGGAIPGWGRDYDDSYHRGACNRVFTGGPFASSIQLPVIPKKQSHAGVVG